MALDWLPRDHEIKDHTLWGDEHFGTEPPCTMYELRSVLDNKSNAVDVLKAAWIILNNPKQYNSYNTEMVKGGMPMKMLIHCEWIDREEKINVLNPYDGQVVDTVPSHAVSLLLSCQKLGADEVIKSKGKSMSNKPYHLMEGRTSLKSKIKLKHVFRKPSNKKGRHVSTYQ